MENDPEVDELVRKRQRNRVAQQKYRRRLKSHIEDLEKKAAVADRLVKGKETLLSEDLAPSSEPCSNPQMNAQGPSISAAVNMLQRMKASTATAVSAAGESPATLPRKSNLSGSESGLNADDEFLKGLLLSADDLSGNQNSFFTDTGVVEIQEGYAESMETNLFSAGAEVEVLPKSLLDMPLELDHGSLEARVDYVLQAIRNAGFPTLDTFVSSFYTASFRERSAAQKAQEVSHSSGLPMMLDELRLRSGDWPVWQARAYTDSIIRSAASIITDEFDRLTKKSYECEKELQLCLGSTTPRTQTATPTTARSPSMQRLHVAAAELRKTLRNELPNLNALTAMLSSDNSVLSQSTRVQLLVVTIQIIAANGDEPLEEVANWICHRLDSRFSMNPRSRDGDDFERGTYMSRS